LKLEKYNLQRNRPLINQKERIGKEYAEAHKLAKEMADAIEVTEKFYNVRFWFTLYHNIAIYTRHGSKLFSIH